MKILRFAALISTVFAAGQAQASTLEERLRRQLDRLFFTEQYMLDVNPIAGAASETTDEPLPGLAAVATLAEDEIAGGGFDILLVLDTSVSPERAKIAEEMVRRQSANDGGHVNLAVRREAMMKVPPRELAPLAPRQVDESKPPRADAPPPVPEARKPEPPPPTSLFDFIDGKRDLATKVLLVIWSAAASMLGLHAILSRFGRRDRGTTAPGANTAAAPAPDGKTEGKGEAQTRDTLYSRDAALRKMAAEMVEEAQRTPEKVASVLTRWIEISEENARYAGVFLKNCDVRTIENLCRNLHPSDADRVVTRNDKDFDPLSDDNRKVLEMMRSDLARLASRQSVKTRPEPLQFLRLLSDDELARVLDGESVENVALVATQVPVYRLTKYLSGLSQDEYKHLFDLIVTMADATPKDFEALKISLTQRVGSLSDVLVDDAARVNATRQILGLVPSASRQMALATELCAAHPAAYAAIRSNLTLAGDLAWLPPRAAKFFFQSVDGDLLAAAIGDAKIDMDQLLQAMPIAVCDAFRDGTKRERDDAERETAWRRILQALDSLIDTGLIAPSEIALARARTDATMKVVGHAALREVA